MYLNRAIRSKKKRKEKKKSEVDSANASGTQVEDSCPKGGGEGWCKRKEVFCDQPNGCVREKGEGGV